MSGAAKLPGTLAKDPALDSWIAVNADGTITVKTGKVEIGQGIKTAVAVVAAEELDIALDRIRVQTADTGLTPDEKTTSGSQSMQHSASAIRQAAAECRHHLLELAAASLGVAADDLTVEDGTIRSRRTNRQTDYWTLLGGKRFDRQATGMVRVKAPSSHRLVGGQTGRLDLPAKVFGEAAYVHDMELPGMVHGRVVRPTSQRVRLASIDTSTVEKMTGVIGMVRDGSFLAVVAEREIDAVRARAALFEAAKWAAPEGENPDEDRLYDWMLEQEAIDGGCIEGEHTDEMPPETPPPAGAAATLDAFYAKPYILHGAMGPSCAIAQMEGDQLTVWTHSQGVYPLRGALASVLEVAPENIRCIHVEGAGCYGHNGADDVALDAALLARAFPAKPVRVQWQREDEHVWEPFSTPMVVKPRGSIDEAGKVIDWRFDIWSHNHGQRPSASKNHSSLLAAGEIAKAWPRPPKKPGSGFEASEHRNGWPAYSFDVTKVAKHFIPASTFRCSSMRGLGAFCNVFGIEGMMDELAEAAGQDGLAFRLRHLADPRARAVLQAAADALGWTPRKGQGIAYGRYKNMAAYCAVAAEVSFDSTSSLIRVERVGAAVDVGEAVTPDNVINQIEGGIVQATSWTLKERIRFDATDVISRDWAGYPILGFPEAPVIKTTVLNQPGQPFLGVGEASQGPTPAAIANAFFQLTGVRLRELPFTPERVRAMLSAAGRN
jgi:nicotinate dehydrogenase subunit B